MITRTTQQTQYDESLRKFMLNMFNHVGAGLLLSGIVAWLTFSTPALASLMFASGLGTMIMWAPLVMILLYSFTSQSWSLDSLKLFYYIFTAVMGMSLSSLFFIYTGESLLQVFFITSATFLSASLYGYTTKKNLASMGGFLFMGLIGIIIASIVNIFLGSGMLAFIISILGVIIFTGLTAWDVQNAKLVFLSAPTHTEGEKYGVRAAISLYLNFINMFQMLLMLMGNRN